MKPLVLWSSSQDPYLNAAHEEWLYTNVAPKEPVYFLWQNRESVCIGRYQNPWSELNMKSIEESHIPIVRRISGGGTVFHDLGNLNISYMHPGSEYDKKIRMLPVINHLKTFGDISLSEKGDGLLQIDEKYYKFSGSAFKNRHTSSLHHFTLLMNSDLNRLWQFLKRNKSDSFQGRSMPSTRMEVKNLNISNAKEWAYDWATQHGFGWQELISEQLNQTYVPKFSSSDWNLAETPDFNFHDRQNQHFLTIQKGKIIGEDGQNFSHEVDCHFSMVSALRNQILGDYSFDDLF